MTITNVKEYDILPSRWDYFERRMEKLKEAAGRKIPPIDFKYTWKNATTKPLDPILIPRAMRGSVPDARQLPNGDWVRDVIPVKIEYGDLINPKFDYIGYVNYGTVKDTAGSLKKAIFPFIVKDAAMSDEEHEKRVAAMTPKLKAIGEQWTSTKSVKCELCNPKGDDISRHTAYIVQAKEDVKQQTKKSQKGLQPQLDLKKGDILQLGSACLSDFMGLDVDKIAAFYELDRAVGAYGPNGSPSNPAGWGYKEMGVYDFADRLIMYYGQREREWLSAVKQPLWKIKEPEELYAKGTLAKLIDKKIKRGKGDGCFVGMADPNSITGQKNPYNVRIANGLMKGRVFNLNQNDPSMTPQWMFQPYTGTGSVDEMIQLWEDGLNDAFEYQTVMIVNEETGVPEVDANTGDIIEMEVKVPSAEYIRDKLRGSYYNRGEWKLKIVPIMPPASESDYVEDTRNRMMDWIKNVDINSTEYKGQADLIQRLKSTVQLGYVGEKTVREFPHIWRLFMLHDFKRRQKQDYKIQRNELKQKVGEMLKNSPKGNYSDGKWFTVKRLGENDYWYEYLNTIYRYWADRNRAYQQEYEMVFLTQAQFDAYADFAKQQEMAKIAAQKEREENAKYRDAANAIYYDNRNAYMRNVPYEPNVDDFLTLLGWDSLKGDMGRLQQFGRNVIRINPNNNTVRQARLDEDQMTKVRNEFRPQLVTTTGVVPTQPAPQPTTTSTTSRNTAPKITQAEARRKMESMRGVNQAYYVGKSLPQGEAYLCNIAPPLSREGFYRRGMARRGRTLTFVNSIDKEVFVVFYYGADIPKIGNYYNFYDVKVTQHSAYKGLNQMVIESEDGGQIEFIDSTTP